jgi:hypothetical protein
LVGVAEEWEEPFCRGRGEVEGEEELESFGYVKARWTIEWKIDARANT